MTSCRCFYQKKGESSNKIGRISLFIIKRAKGENRTLVLRTTTARTAIILHSPNIYVGSNLLFPTLLIIEAKLLKIFCMPIVNKFDCHIKELEVGFLMVFVYKF